MLTHSHTHTRHGSHALYLTYLSTLEHVLLALIHMLFFSRPGHEAPLSEGAAVEQKSVSGPHRAQVEGGTLLVNSERCS